MRAELATTPKFFDYGSHRIRVFDINRGQRVAVAADICDVLGLTNPTMAMANVSDADKVTIRRSEALSGTEGIWEQMAPQVHVVTLITEDGATDLVLESRKPEARAFRRWLTHEVWPSIRDTGSYSVAPAATAPALTEDEIVHQALQITARRVDELTAKIAELEPKADEFDAWMSAEVSLPMLETAELLGWGRNTMMKALRQQAILTAKNLPYARYLHHFNVVPKVRYDSEGRTIPYTVTEVRPSAIPWLRNRLVEESR